MSNEKLLNTGEPQPKGLGRVGTLAYILLIVLTFIIIASTFTVNRVSLKAGDIAPDDIYYFGTATSFISQIYTEQAQQMAAGEVEQIYKYDDQALPNMQMQVDSLFDALNVVRGAAAETDENLLSALGELLTPAEGEDAEPPRRAVTEYFAGVDDETELALRNGLKVALTAAYGSENWEEKDLPEVIERCEDNIKGSGYERQAVNFLLAAAKMLDFKPTYIVDQVGTMDAVSKAIGSVQPISLTVYPGQQIVRRGTEVSAAEVETLEALNLQRPGSDMQAYIGLLLLVIVCYTPLRAYCTNLGGDNKIASGNISMIALLFVIILLIARVITLIKFDSALTSDWMLGLAIPVPAFSMLVAALINKRTAIFATIVVSIFIGIMCDVHLLYVCAALIGGLVAVLQISRMNSRSYYAVAVFYIAFSYAMVAVSWCLMWSYERPAFYVALLMSFVNGILSVILTVGALPLLESAFSITTSIRLMELANINHPLLKKLMIEAPGTYNHSILVGNLAEAAADRIGADGLLVRVAAYFHDIGKVKRPNFFVENQKPGDNPHDKLQPSLSTFIITSHTKEGSEMARGYKLPKEIIDVIEQHHGTSLVQGFYKKAAEVAEAAGTEPPRPEDFCYPGPKPQTREAALVMLADSCQAAVQSMKNSTSGQVEGMVRDIIKGKLNDGQLDQCALTFRDLDIIASTYATILAGANHYRLPYPEQLTKELAKRKKQEEEAAAEKNNAENGDKENNYENNNQ